MTARLPACPVPPPFGTPNLWTMELINGIDALRWAKEISKLPDGCYTGELHSSLTLPVRKAYRHKPPEGP